MTDSNSDSDVMEHDGTIRAQLAPGYWIRALLVGLICLGFGIWGLYDYIYAIPQQEEGAQRREIAQAVKVVIDDQAANPEMYEAAMEDINAGLANYTTPVSPVVDSSSSITTDAGWQNALEQWKSTLEAMQVPGSGASSGSLGLIADAKAEVERANTAYGDIQAPSAYDRPIQWIFIVSLVFVPYYIRQLMLHRGKEYTLDQDGGFHGPHGTLRADEIADIDMSRWMKKSIAELVDSNGQRITLDAYIYKDLHLIIGAIAHRLHPDKWTLDAKIVKEPAEADSTTSSSEEQDQ